MLKELVQYLENRPAPNYFEHAGRTYADKELHSIPNTSPDCLGTTTLKSIVDYIIKDVDVTGSFTPERYIIHIQSHSEVSLLSEVNEDGKRWKRMFAEAITPDISFGRFMDTEIFNITLQSKFINDDNCKKVLSVIGNITDSTINGFQDDGITQSVTVKAGIQRVGKTNVPNPIELTPYRTFSEVEQPASPFVLRMQSGRNEGDLPQAALFEADGTAWRLDAIQHIKEYFEKELPGELLESGKVVIIA